MKRIVILAVVLVMLLASIGGCWVGLDVDGRGGGRGGGHDGGGGRDGGGGHDGGGGRDGGGGHDNDQKH